MRRKLLLVGISTIAGIVLAYHYGIISVIIIGVLVITTVSLGANILKHENKLILLILFSVLIGSLLLTCSDYCQWSEPINDYNQVNTEFKGIITRAEKYDDESYKLCCSLTKVGNSNIKGKILISIYKDLPNYWNLYGKEIAFSTKLEIPKGAANPRTFDYRLYLRTKGITHIGTINYFQETERKVSIFYRIEQKIIGQREKMINSLNCSDDVRGFVRGILFGDTKMLKEDIYEDFQHNGTAHVLAVSGLHVGILYTLYRRLVGKRKNIFAMLGFMVVLIIYGTATLWSVSVTRAIFLIGIIMVGKAFDRRYDILTALAFVTIVVVIKNPWTVFAAGFQMSFLAVISIAFMAPILERWVGFEISAVLAVQLGLAPYIGYMFNYVSLTSFFCNIPVVFLVSIFVPMGILQFFLVGAVGIDIPLVGDGISALGSLIIKVNQWLSMGGVFAKDVESPPMWMVFAIYGFGFFLMSEFFRVYLHRRQWKTIFIPAALIGSMVILSVFWFSSPFDKAGIVFVDVGQGDCIEIKDGGKQTILIDGGGNANYNVGKKILKPYFLKNHRSNIDLAAATHLHMDHFLGLEQLSKCFPIKKAFLRGTVGQRISLSKNRWIDIIWPEKYDDDTEDENKNCMVFKVNYDGITALITGDIGQEGEKALIEKYKGTDTLRCDILKVGHHGSKYSSCSEFIDAVDPKIAVISVGKNNYGHPSDEVIEKFEKKGIMVIRTDKSGAIGIITRKGKIKVCTNKGKNTALRSFQRT